MALRYVRRRFARPHSAPHQARPKRQKVVEHRLRTSSLAFPSPPSTLNPGREGGSLILAQRVGTGNLPWRGSKTIDHNWVSFYTRDNVHQKRSTDSKTLRRAPIVHPQVAQRRVAGCEGTRCFARIPAHKSVGAQRGIVSDALPVFQTFPVVALRALHARDPFRSWELSAGSFQHA